MRSNPSPFGYFPGKGKIIKAFTLVELIVVITILAILGTIAFLSFQGYSRDARDSKRTSDLSNLKTSLELYNVNTGKLPIPDSYTTITYSGGIDDVWYQGIAGDQVTTNLKQLNEKPLDPLTNSAYTYSVTNSYKEYELLVLYEGNIAYNPIINNANAATTTLTPKIDGNYNGVYVKTNNYIIPVPSIVTSEDIVPGSGKELTTGLIKSLVITNGTNIPKTTVSQTSTGQLNINLSVYTGSITKASTDIEKINAMKEIQRAYIGTSLESDNKISYLINKRSNFDVINTVNTTILNLPEIPGSGWMLVDKNCRNPDITIGNQVWAGCNSTLGNGEEFGQRTSDVGTNNYNGTIMNCYDYNGGNTGICTPGDITMASNSFANMWFPGVSNSGDREVANIWGKFYNYNTAASACTLGYRLPTDGDFTTLEQTLGCPVGDANRLDINAPGEGCAGLGWKNRTTAGATASNNIIEALQLPLSGYHLINDNSYGYRGIGLTLWAEPIVSSTIIARSIWNTNNTINRAIWNASHGISVRCIKSL